MSTIYEIKPNSFGAGALKWKCVAVASPGSLGYWKITQQYCKSALYLLINAMPHNMTEYDSNSFSDRGRIMHDPSSLRSMRFPTWQNITRTPSHPDSGQTMHDHLYQTTYRAIHQIQCQIPPSAKQQTKELYPTPKNQNQMSQRMKTKNW